MIGQQEVAFYRDNGYLVVPDVLSPAEVEALREVTDAFVERAREITSHNEIYDLEDSHSVAEPRVRRIKTPHQWDDTYRRWSTIRTSWRCCRSCGAPRSASTSASST